MSFLKDEVRNIIFQEYPILGDVTKIGEHPHEYAPPSDYIELFENYNEETQKKKISKLLLHFFGHLDLPELVALIETQSDVKDYHERVEIIKRIIEE
jgi:hypothetical protein